MTLKAGVNNISQSQQDRLRKEALDQAALSLIASKGSLPTAEEVVARAEVYYRFLSGASSEPSTQSTTPLETC